jgi:hypothetical protein
VSLISCFHYTNFSEQIGNRILDSRSGIAYHFGRVLSADHHSVKRQCLRMVLMLQQKPEQRGTTLSTSVLSTERDRSKIPEEFLWDLSPVFPDFAAWTRAKEAFVGTARLDSSGDARELRRASASCLDACDRAQEGVRLATPIRRLMPISTPETVAFGHRKSVSWAPR